MINEETVISKILDEAFYIHKTVGPGMLESVYKTFLAYRLTEQGLFVETEKAVRFTLKESRWIVGTERIS